MQVGGWHMAVIAAAPGNRGVTDPVDAGIVVGVVDTKFSDNPVSVTPFVSVTVAVIGCVLFGFTEMLVPPFGTLNVIEAGGHVEKNPAELPASDTLELIVVDPGCSAVATPFWSIDTTDDV